MSLSVICPNGHKIAANEKYFGKTVLCPKCKEKVAIPFPEEPEPLDELSLDDDPFSTGGDAAGFGGGDPLGAAQFESSEDPFAASLGQDDLFAELDLSQVAAAPSNPLPHVPSLGPVMPQANSPIQPGLAQPSGLAQGSRDARQEPDELPKKEAKFNLRSVPLIVWIGVASGAGVSLLVGAVVILLLLRGGDSKEVASNTASEATAATATLEMPPPTAVTAKVHPAPATAAAEVRPAPAAVVAVPAAAPALVSDSTADLALPEDVPPVKPKLDATTRSPAASTTPPRKKATTGPPADAATELPPVPRTPESYPLTAATFQDSPSAADLKKINSDSRIDAFQFPDRIWMAAYDARSGKLAVNHDETGIVIYDIDEVGQGRFAPHATIPVSGIPSAVCCKVLNDKTVFVVAGKDAPKVEVFSAEDLKKLGEVTIGEAKYLDYLYGSTNPNDPYVYYSTQYEQSPEDSAGANCLGRIHLPLMKFDSQTASDRAREDRYDVVTSADGALVYTAGAAYEWNVEYDGKTAELKPLMARARAGATSHHPDPTGTAVATGVAVYGRNMWRTLAIAKFEPHSFFMNAPFIAGTKEGSLCIGSANTYEMLADVPLPLDWFEKQNTYNIDFRYRPKISMDFRRENSNNEWLFSPFLSIYADDTRQAAIGVYSKHLAILPWHRVNLKAEVSLIAKNLPPARIETGAETKIEFQFDSKDIALELVTEAKDERNERDDVPILGSRPLRTAEPQLYLAAAVNASQDIIFVRDVSPIAAHPLPQNILIGSELMTVVGIDDFKTALKVKRANGTDHSVTSSVVRIGAGGAEPPVLPVIEGTTLKWKPTHAQTGYFPVLLRSRSGKRAHHFLWEVTVERPTAKLPFIATGVKVSDNGKIAAVWGYPKMPKLGKDQVIDPSQKQILGIYDLEQRKLLTSRELPDQITAAVYDESGVYIALYKLGAGNQIEQRLTATQIIRLDPETLMPKEQADVPAHASELQIVAGKYLAAQTITGSAFRLLLPSLKPTDPNVPLINDLSVVGKIGDRWLFDGVIWDKDGKSPELLLHASKFNGLSLFDVPLGSLGEIRFANQGPLACIYDRRQRINQATGRIATDPLNEWTTGMASSAEKSLPRKMSSAGGITAVAALGKVQFVPAPPPVSRVGNVQFEERQSTFVLRPGKSNSVKYKAAGAANYMIELYAQLLDANHRDVRYHDEQRRRSMFFSANSSTGEFDIKFDLSDEFMRNVKEGIEKAKFANDVLNDFLGRSESPSLPVPFYRQLTGRAPQGTPVPIYALVIAENEEQTERTALFHCYIVEIPEKVVNNPNGSPSVADDPPAARRPAGRNAGKAETASTSPKKTETPRKKPTANPSANRLTAVDYSYSIRLNRPAGMSPDAALDQARAEAQEMNERLSAAGGSGAATQTAREWTNDQGKKITATFVRLEEDTIELSANGKTYRLPLARLSPADQEWAKQRASQSAAATAGGSSPMATIAAALAAHADRVGSFPPAALVSKDGKALLSWRVLILEELGYPKLAAAFHYDEPWDSEHNRKLIPLMPAIYRVDPAVADETGTTAFLSVTGPATMLSTSYSTREEDIKGEKSDAVLFSKVGNDVATVWSKPEDINVLQISKLPEILAEQPLGIPIATADGAIGYVPAATSETEWKKLISITDTLKLEATITRP